MLPRLMNKLTEFSPQPFPLFPALFIKYTRVYTLISVCCQIILKISIQCFDWLIMFPIRVHVHILTTF